MTKYPCYGCLPPKRTTTCKFDGTCDKYSKAKAKHDQEKAIADRERDVSVALILDRRDKVYKAMKDRRRKRT